MPEGIAGTTPCQACPHNVYEQHPEVFDARDDVAGTVIRLFRLVSSAEMRLLEEVELDALTATELFTARSELDKMAREKSEKEQARQKAQQQAQQEKALSESTAPKVMGSE